MIRELFLTPARAMLGEAGKFISALAAVVLILLVGWFVAKIVKNIAVRILEALQIDSYTERVGVDKVLAKGGIKYGVTELIGVLSYWLVMLIAMVIAVSAVDLNQQAGSLLNSIVLYIPKVISAIFIIVLGMFFASFVNSAIQTASANAGIGQSALLGKLSQIIIIVFAVDIALRQINIDIAGIENAVMIILGAVGLALALAFGLGCKDIAGKLTQEFIDKVKTKK